MIAVLMAQAVYALVALNGSFFGGGLPARGCFFYHIPPSDLPADGNLSSWELSVSQCPLRWLTRAWMLLPLTH